MNEIIFVVEEADEGGWLARALGESIFTEADTLDELHDAVRDAVRCHFDSPGDASRVVLSVAAHLGLTPDEAARRLFEH